MVTSKSKVKNCKTALIINDGVLETHYSMVVLEKSKVAEQIVAKKSAWEALQHLEELYKEGRELPRLVFLDMQMTELNGYDFLEALQVMKAEIKTYCKIIIINGSEEKSKHDAVMSFPQVKLYLTSNLTFEVMDRYLPEIKAICINVNSNEKTMI